MCPAWARLFVRFFSWHCRKIWAEKCWKQFQVEDNSAWDHYIWRTNEEYFLLFGRTDHDDGQELQEDQPLWFLVHCDWCVLVLLQLLGEPEQSLPHLWFEDAIPCELWWAQGGVFVCWSESCCCINSLCTSVWEDALQHGGGCCARDAGLREEGGICSLWCSVETRC